MAKVERPMVHDFDFMLEWMQGTVDSKQFFAYVSGMATGLNISKTFVDAKAISLRDDGWRVLRGELYPVPSIQEFIAEIERATFGKVVLTKSHFVNPDLRYVNISTDYYGMGIADATMLAMVQVPRLYKAMDEEIWTEKTTHWIELKLWALDFLLS